MTELHQAFQEVLEGMKDLHAELNEKAQNLPEDKVAELQRSFTETFHERVNRREVEICKKHGVSSEELSASLLVHQEDPSLAYLVQSLGRFYGDDDEDGDKGDGSEDVDESEFPAMPEVVKAMGTVLELSIVVMEEVFKQVAAKLDPDAVAAGKTPKLTPQFVSVLNRNYTEQFMRVRAEVFQRMGITERVLTAASVKYQNAPEFVAMLKNHAAEKARRFKALGLAQIQGESNDDE